MLWRSTITIAGLAAFLVASGLLGHRLGVYAQSGDPFVDDALPSLLDAEKLPLDDALVLGEDADAELPPPAGNSNEPLAPLTIDVESQNGPRDPMGDVGFDPPAMEPVPTLDPVEEYADAESDVEDDLEIVPQETIRERYPDGQVKIERGVTQDENDNYLNHGPWRMYDPQGKLIIEGTYQFGERHGKWSRLQLANEAGLFASQPFNLFNEPFLSEAEFRDGKLNGTWTIRDGADLKVCDWNFIDGYRHGDSSWFYHNGRTMRVIQYVQGEIHGELSEWDVDGDPLTTVRYDRGRRLEETTERHEDGRKKLEGMVLKAKLNVQDQDNWWDTKLATYKSEGKDEKHGKWTAWYLSGQMKFTGEYANNQPVGKFTWWHQNGQKMLEGLYESGEKIGQWTWWHENGVKSIQGQYMENLPVEDWIWWHETGKVAQRVNFSGPGSGVEYEPGQISNSVQRFLRPSASTDNRR